MGDFDEFHACLYGEPGKRATSAIGKIREILAKRSGGTTSLKGMALEFKILDQEGNGNVTRNEFQLGFEKFIRAFDLDLSTYEFDELFKLFDRDGSGTVSYDEFI